MPNTVISVENLSKSYRLGAIGTGTFYGDIKRWWARQRGMPDPYLKIGEADHGNRDGETVWALQDINFTVQQGEAVGIVGRNGAGKSTLLKILSQVTSPTTGAVKVKGRIASLLEVGTGFHAELTGRENIYLNGAIMGMSRAEVNRKLDEIVDFSGVEKFIDTPVKRYSSGMYVRLAFAVAAHLEPDILVVDEVLAVGDAEFQKKCLGKMDAVAHQQGRTILFVSHNMSALKALCEKTILLKSGAIQSQGPSENIIREYLSEQKYGSLNTSISVDAHQSYPPDFEVTKVELVNSRAEYVEQLLVQEPFECRFHYKINVDGYYRFAIHFRSTDGTLLALVQNLSGGGHLHGKFGEEYQICFQSITPFLPGEYTLEIVVKEQSGAYVDRISGLKFLVAPLSLKGEKLVGAGYVYLDAKWTEPIPALKLS
jgi:ABC-type polysaccharide/polyol phosphate transport system ATPase subunit